MSLTDLLTEIGRQNTSPNKYLQISRRQLADIKLLTWGSGEPVWKPGFGDDQDTILGLPYGIVEHGCRTVDSETYWRSCSKRTVAKVRGKWCMWMANQGYGPPLVQCESWEEAITWCIPDPESMNIPK